MGAPIWVVSLFLLGAQCDMVDNFRREGKWSMYYPVRGRWGDGLNWVWGVVVLDWNWIGIACMCWIGIVRCFTFFLNVGLASYNVSKNVHTRWDEWFAG